MINDKYMGDRVLLKLACLVYLVNIIIAILNIETTVNCLTTNCTKTNERCLHINLRDGNIKLIVNYIIVIENL